MIDREMTQNLLITTWLVALGVTATLALGYAIATSADTVRRNNRREEALRGAIAIEQARFHASLCPACRERLEHAQNSGKEPKP